MFTGKEILVADDEAIIRKVLFEVLSAEGFKVTLAKDGQETLDQMAHHCFDLLITDVNMPRLSGIGLLRRMKKDGRREKVILMTGNPRTDSYIEKDLQAVFSLVQKPFRIQGLLSAVAAALAESNGPGPYQSELTRTPGTSMRSARQHTMWVRPGKIEMGRSEAELI